MRQRIDFSLILPCYNEEKIFTQSIEQILRVLRISRFTSEIIFVDDGSTDKTPRFIRSTLRKYRFCKALYHVRNEGRGKSVADGIRVANGTAVGYIDIDCEVTPEYIPLFVQAIVAGQADIMIGERIYRIAPGSLSRAFFSVGYRLLASVLVDTGNIDTESGYKFFLRKKILTILPLVEHPRWFWDTEIVVVARKHGLRVSQKPVLFLRRLDKQSTVHVGGDIWDYFVSLWRLRRRLSAGVGMPGRTRHSRSML